MSNVLITGANRGIGLELARCYAGNGDTVFACCRSPEEASDLIALKNEHDNNVQIFPLDVTDPDSISGLKAILDEMPIDILINNAGIIGPENQSTWNMDFDGFIETLNINTLSPLRILQAFLDNLKASTSPKAITISSRMGSFTSTNTNQIAYRASKAAVNRVMFAAAADLKKDGITVAVMHPGWVRTDMGGPGADISPTQSGAGLFKVIENLQIYNSGGYFDWDGSDIKW